MTDETADHPPRMQDIVFAHIPKTAGTSLRNTLVDVLPDSYKFFDYGSPIIDAGGEFANASDFQTPARASLLALRAKAGQSRPFLVCGHFPFRRYVGVLHPGSFITFLRDPLERLVSAYKHHVRNMAFAGTFEDFYEAPQHINIQSRTFWELDLRTIGFIGLTEMMPDMIQALSEHIGLPLRRRKDNVSSRTGTPAVGERERTRILTLNEDDVRLYQHVKDNLGYYTDFRGRRERVPVLGRGNVKHHGNGLFRGSAVTLEPGRLAEIEVRKGNQVVHRCYADQFWPGRPANIISANRSWGFTVQLPAHLLKGEPIRFSLAGTQKDFEGSPVDPSAKISKPSQQTPRVPG